MVKKYGGKANGSRFSMQLTGPFMDESLQGINAAVSLTLSLS